MAEVLVIGSGGREQALAWKLADSPHVSKVYVAPGNGGSLGIVENLNINFDNVDALVKFAKDKSLDLSVVGQEAASEAGVVDAFKAAGLLIFGPTKSAVKIESSKAFSKGLMRDQGIPTAEYGSFTDVDEARAFAKSRPFPVVIKADGLATGKGVIIAYNADQVEQALKSLMVNKEFGGAGDTVVIEDFLKGREISLHALCDGKTSVMFPASQDHKQAYDGDAGPNTGGMGVIAPLNWVDDKLLTEINNKVVQPALKGLIDNSSPFTGCLYPGLMIDKENIKVLEYNARFGDPEAEVYMRLLDSDLYTLLRACAMGDLSPLMVKWKKGYAVSVVIAAAGYPGKYKKGSPISGIEEAEKIDGVKVFHAGTAIIDGQLVTAGGRVLNVTALGKSLEEALDNAYKAVAVIDFKGMYYRTDIGRRNI